jgi:DNA-binding PadR family transcriptional regulator
VSVEMMTLVFKHYPGQGGELVLALSVADHAHDDGRGIFPSIPALAVKTRQSERTVQRQLRDMEQKGWLQCEQRSAGGRNRSSRYRINPEWIEAPQAFAWKAVNGDILSPFKGEKPRQNVTVFAPETVTSEARNGDTAVSPAKNHQETSNTPDSPFSKAGSAVPSDSDDRKAGEWMLTRLRVMNPGHREPNWRRWDREIRLMRERDKRTHREICALFAWANGHSFWAGNILSPGKLRDKWDQLVIAQKSNGGAGRESPPAVKSSDWVCHCGKHAVVVLPGGQAVCSQHREAA